MLVSTSSTLTAEDLKQIRTVVEEQWVRAELDRAWNDTLALCTPDIVYMAPNQPAIHGQAAFRQWLEQFPPILQFQQPVEAIEGRGDFACCRASFSATLDIAGKPVAVTGKALGVLEKDALGQWLTKAVCFNYDQELSVG